MCLVINNFCLVGAFESLVYSFVIFTQTKFWNFVSPSERDCIF